MYTTNTKWAKESKNETTTKKKGYKGGKELKKENGIFSRDARTNRECTMRRQLARS
jgi:hypothetical protein